jgi:hypothetical protein
MSSLQSAINSLIILFNESLKMNLNKDSKPAKQNKALEVMSQLNSLASQVGKGPVVRNS